MAKKTRRDVLHTLIAGAFSVSMNSPSNNSITTEETARSGVDKLLDELHKDFAEYGPVDLEFSGTTHNYNGVENLVLWKNNWQNQDYDEAVRFIPIPEIDDSHPEMQWFIEEARNGGTYIHTSPEGVFSGQTSEDIWSSVKSETLTYTETIDYSHKTQSDDLHKNTYSQNINDWLSTGW